LTLSYCNLQVVGSLCDGTPVLLSEATHLYRVDVSDILESGTETRRSTLITTVRSHCPVLNRPRRRPSIKVLAHMGTKQLCLRANLEMRPICC
jgi:hypothetical protein